MFFAVVAWLLYDNAREIDWSEVGSALFALPTLNIAIAAVLVVSSHALYSTFDLVTRAHVGFRLSTRRVMTTTFVCYAFNLNLGSLIGALGFRYRLYSRQGLANGQIARLAAFSIWTNWFGYIVLAGTVFLLYPIALPPGWPLSGTALQGLGVLLLAIAISYVVACAAATKRVWTFRGYQFELPTLNLAGVQLLVATGNWLITAMIVWTLLQWRVDFPTALTVLLLAAVAGVVTHIPASVGVLEAVFVTLLADQLPINEVLGALLAYRALYYLMPLAIASLVCLGFERSIGAASREDTRDA